MLLDMFRVDEYPDMRPEARPELNRRVNDGGSSEL